MSAYAYPIIIDYDKKTINETEIYYIEEDVITIKVLSDIVGENKFSILEKEVPSDPAYKIEVYHSRLETDKEYNERIKKEESYMAEYNKRNT